MSVTGGKVPRMPQPTPWTAEQVAALAPDAGSLAAARRLARPRLWSGCGTGGERPGVWGLCHGSGKTPYQTCVDLIEPAYRCSCPSRKFPCKHALALLLLWAEGGLPEAQEPGWVSEWQAGRAARAAKRQQKAAPRTQAQERAAKRRAGERLDRVTAGAADLHQWLTDQVRHGIAGLDQAGYTHFERMATRMVDAQAPGLAGMVRRLGGVPHSGDGWEGRMLAELSLLHLLTGAAARLDELPAELAATVRSRLGKTVAAEEVLATPPIRDTWQVVGVRDFIEEERLSTRRVWLIGRGTGREAMVLSFAAPGQALPADLVLGTAIEADACFYPGAHPRALIATRHGPAQPCPDAAPALTLDEALGRLAAALARDPWLGSWPMLVRGCLVPGKKWSVVDTTGAALALLAAETGWWDLAGAAGGRPTTIALEWNPVGLVPMAAFVDEAVVSA